MSESISRRAHELFLAASKLPAEARDAMLSETCSNDPALRREVESLLEASSESNRYFSEFAERLGVAGLFASPDVLADQDRIGNYRLIRLIGRGGMGAVYLAERADRQFEKKVAIKVLPIGVSSAEAERRFLAERQILARLVHPGIARLLDGGVTDRGIPYFVMDYIEGEPIDQFCDRKRLGLRARLDLFGRVCDAVQFAHRSLVVHRDLKPGNILVTGSGEVCLVDFGIAKLLDERAADSTLTQAGRAPMTLAYASPEMILGQPVTTASDVYALGVLLNLMLTGHPPYRLSGLSDADLRKTICELEPPLASRAVTTPAERRGPDGDPVEVSAAELAAERASTPAGLSSRLRGDLDTILAKALRKDPERRYASVEQFWEDIRRYRDGLPIIARPPTFGYRAGKFVRRYRAAVLASAAVVLALMMVAALAIRNAIESAEQAQVIAAERDKAEQIKDFLLSVFELSGPNQTKGETVTARELLDRSAERIRSELADQPRRQALLLHAIAEVYSELSLFDKAKPLLEDGARLLLDSDGPSADYATTMALLTEILEIEGDYEAAEAMAGQLIEVRRNLAVPEDTAAALLLRGRILHKRGQAEEAEPLYREGLSIQRASLDPRHTEIARSLSYLGSLLEQRGELDEAESMHRESLSIRQDHYGDEHMILVESFHNLAAVLMKKERYDEAKSLLGQALSINRKLLPDGDHGSAFIYNAMGTASERSGDLESARTNYGEALDIVIRFFGGQHPNAAIVKGNLGRVLVRLEREDEGEPLLEQAIETLAAAIPNHGYLPRMRLYRGLGLLGLARYKEAEPLLHESYRALDETVGPDHEYTRVAVNGLIEFYTVTGAPERAAEYRQIKEQSGAPAG